MNPIETTANTAAKTVASNGQSSHSRHSYQKVRDGRKQPIRGLWLRNGKYLARLTAEDPTTGKKEVRWAPLEDKDGHPVKTTAEAKEALGRLKVQRTDSNLPVLKRTPLFKEYVETYLAYLKAGTGRKKPRTIKKEENTLRRWAGLVEEPKKPLKESLGDIRLDKIRLVHVNAYTDARQAANKKARTINLDVICLRNILKRAIKDGWIYSLPMQNWDKHTVTHKRRALITLADIDRICAAATSGQRKNRKGQPVLTQRNAQQFCDYVRFMAFSGARASEALAVRWDDVAFGRKQLTIGADGDTKNRTARTVDFTPMLETHLMDMDARKAPDSKWLFPSPQRKEGKDTPAKTFRESLLMARGAAAMPNFIFHDCRHFFISMCVMSGIDYMTIAAWVGHKDGGVLIGKVYGHLADAHKKAMAQKVTFEPTILPAEQPANVVGLAG
jgi:integrase